MVGLKTRNLILAGACLTIGVAIMLIAAGVINVADDSVHAPRWVLGLCGLVFALAACMIFAGEKSRFNPLGAALVCGSFGLVGGWITVFAPYGSITGGIPFLSQVTNDTIGRCVFGAGALLCFAIAWVALRQFLRWQAPASASD